MNLNLARYSIPVGLLGLALYEVTVGDYANAGHNLTVALGLLGFHVAEAQAARRLSFVEDVSENTAARAAALDGKVTNLTKAMTADVLPWSELKDPKTSSTWEGETK